MAVPGGGALEHGVAYKGQLADMQARNKISKLNKSGATIEYGLGLVTDGEGAAKLPGDASTAAEFVGVLARELNRAYADGETFGAQDKRDMTIVTHGVVFVEALDTVTKDADVYLRVGSTGRGNFSGIAGAGVTAGVQIAGAKFLTGGDAGDLVKVSLGIGG